MFEMEGHSHLNLCFDLSSFFKKQKKILGIKATAAEICLHSITFCIQSDRDRESR